MSGSFRSGTEEDVSQLHDILANFVSVLDDEKLKKEGESEAKQKKIELQKANLRRFVLRPSTTFNRKLESEFNLICFFFYRSTFTR